MIWTTLFWLGKTLHTSPLLKKKIIPTLTISIKLSVTSVPDMKQELLRVSQGWQKHKPDSQRYQ